MKALLKSSFLREVAIFAALLSLAALVSTFFADISFAATSLIDPSDNPSAISDATGGESSFKALAQTLLNYAPKLPWIRGNNHGDLRRCTLCDFSR